MQGATAKNFFLLAVSFGLYVFLGYCVSRHETILLLSAYFVLFAIYAYICFSAQPDNSFWMYASILFRTALLFCIPALSDDFYRFIWDGRLLAEGIHPFANVPSYYIGSGINGLSEELYQQLNSKDYFTVYPPVCQFVFWISAEAGADSVFISVIVMRLFILLAEIGTVMLIPGILALMGLPRSRVLLYALNPLVILELTGNLHFDALMIFFVMTSVYFLLQRRLWQSAILFGFGVCVKFLPLIFLPALIRQIGLRKSLMFYLITGITIVILFVPIFNPVIIDGLSESLGYYFQKFEFNASLYYIVRALGFWIFGFNIIQYSGWAMAFIAFCLVLLISLRKGTTRSDALDHSHFVTMLFCLSVYFLFTTTLHPWYLTLLVAISLFTEYRYPIVWTALIFLTYTGYDITTYHENLWVIAIEYLTAGTYLSYELLWKRHRITS